jgi:UDP-N-acetylglucosamine 1-carboxyvinyltransferase
MYGSGRFFVFSLKNRPVSNKITNMEYFEINGQKKLKGEISVMGSKNAATPIIAATLLTKDKCTIDNLPLIEDVFRMLEIIESIGAKVEWKGKRKVEIQSKNISAKNLDENVKKLRSSILLIGPLSTQLNNFEMFHPGGCVIGARPVGTHFDALEKMGVFIKQDKEKYHIDSRSKHPAEIVLKEFSVTATENAMMLAASLVGKTVIKIAAAEPHVEDLGKFLIGMGAKIKGLGTHTLEIEGKKKLHGTTHSIIPDHNEAATYLIMGVATRSPIRVINAMRKNLDLVIEKLKESGANFKFGKNWIEVIPPKKIKSIHKIEMRTYPGIPTDIQAPMGVLATQAEGTTLIFDTLYEGRFNYLHELEKMGANVKVLNPHQAEIVGPVNLKGSDIKSFDLRGGASLIIAALLAKGKSTIYDVYQVDRGYEKIEERLGKLGANIKRISKQ